MTVDVEEEKPTAALFEHCVNVYNEMSEQARDSGDDGLIYDGHLTKLFQGLQLSTPYYTSVRNKLKQMGCIEQLTRGGGTSTSRWRLHREPTVESFNSFQKANKVPQGKFASMEQQLRDMARLISSLENRVSELEEIAQVPSV